MKSKWAAVCKFIIVVCLYNSVHAKTEKKESNIYFSKTWEKVDIQHIANSFKEKQAILIGEQHNDKIGHKAKLELIQYLHTQLPFTLSMEMFERDQQEIMDEYIDGYITKKNFLRDIRLWNNYQDYLAIIQFAKENKIRILASNAPSRYVKIVSKQGFEKLAKLPQSAQKYLPPLYTIYSFWQDAYQEKFYQTLQKHSGHFAGIENMFLAQQLWDASMADSIANQAIQGKKVIHINGRFHSDEFMGVSYRLEKMQISHLTISMFPLSDKEKLDKKLARYADYIYITAKVKKK